MTEGAREGARTLARDPRRSPRAGLSNLLSLNSEAFMRRGLGVLKMERFSRNRALQRKRRGVSEAASGAGGGGRAWHQGGDVGLLRVTEVY